MGGTFPPAEVCAPPPGAPIQIFLRIGPHLRLQDTKCSSIDMPPRKSGAPPSAPPPWKFDPIVTPLPPSTMLHVFFNQGLAVRTRLDPGDEEWWYEILSRMSSDYGITIKRERREKSFVLVESHGWWNLTNVKRHPRPIPRSGRRKAVCPTAGVITFPLIFTVCQESIIVM